MRITILVTSSYRKSYRIVHSDMDTLILFESDIRACQVGIIHDIISLASADTLFVSELILKRN